MTSVAANATNAAGSEHEFFDPKRLSDYLGRCGIAFNPMQPVSRFTSGLANRNYLIVVDDRQVVLRRPPSGDLPPGAHDMLREHRILSALSRTLPIVPNSYHYCPDPSVIGAPFQLIEYRPGVVVRGTDLSEVAFHPNVGARLSELLVTALADLHRVDADAAGLGELGKPSGFVARAILGWTDRGVKTSRRPAVAALVGETSAWLQRQVFRQRQPTLLHCDFKLDNLILDPRNLRLEAVVDWDMGTRGDPLFDLATMLSYWSQPGDPECLLALAQMPTHRPGFWSRERAAAHYADLIGFDLSDLPAFRVLTTLKLGVVFLQLHAQWVRGSVSEARYAGFAQLGEDILLLARDMTRGDGL